MANAEVWISAILNSASYAVGAYAAVRYVLPLVGSFLTEVVRYKKTVDSFVKLLSIMIYLAAVTGIVKAVTSVGDKATGYASIALPGLDLVNGLYGTLKLLAIGVGILILAERIRLK
ncbi:hypothetical protein HYU12_02595 [Candidatus Woesearchaeota archaeon]|nr:hypothetical protein [Candidatus Woesearchaeota archaeon]